MQKSFFSAKRIAFMGLFTALSYILTFFEIPLFPAAPFLKLDLSNAVILLAGFLFGPIEAIVITLLQQLLCYLKTTSGGVGEVANFLITSAYVLIPSIAYRFFRTKKTVYITLAIACIVQLGAAMLCNRYVLFPFYAVLMGQNATEMFASLWVFVLAFNLIKPIAVGAVVLLLYKPISKLFKRLH